MLRDDGNKIGLKPRSEDFPTDSMARAVVSYIVGFSLTVLVSIVPFSPNDVRCRKSLITVCGTAEE